MTYIPKHSTGLTLLTIGAALTLIEIVCHMLGIRFIFRYGVLISPFLIGLISSIFFLLGFIIFNKEFNESLFFPQGKPLSYPIVTMTPQPVTRLCPHCGYAVNEIFNFCPNCGKRLNLRDEDK